MINFDKKSMEEKYEHVDKDFVHGWLALDPLKGFIDEQKTKPIYKKP